MNERIRTLRRVLRLSQREFAGQIGLKQNAISYMEKPGATVTEQNIKTICAQFGVREEWLRTGAGQIFYEREREQRELLELFAGLTPVLQDYLLQVARELLSTQDRLRDEWRSDQGEKNSP